MKNIYTEYGYYSGKHVNLFMFKNMIKDFLRIFTNKYVTFKCKSIWGVRNRIVSKNIPQLIANYEKELFQKI